MNKHEQLASPTHIKWQYIYTDIREWEYTYVYM